MTLNWVLLLVLAFTAIAAYIDHRTGHIPNSVVIGLFVLGASFRLAALLEQAPTAAHAVRIFLLDVFVGAVACAVVPLVLYAARALGGGDVKLFMASGAALGPVLGLELILYSFLVAGLYAPCLLLYQGRLRRALVSTGVLVINMFSRPSRRRALGAEQLTEVRFGPLIFVAACVLAYLSWNTPA